jgi:hypothetical protein
LQVPTERPGSLAATDRIPPRPPKFVIRNDRLTLVMDIVSYNGSRERMRIADTRDSIRCGDLIDLTIALRRLAPGDAPSPHFAAPRVDGIGELAEAGRSDL